MYKLALWVLFVLLPIVATLRRGPPKVVDLNRGAAASATHDYDGLTSVSSQAYAHEMLHLLKSVPFYFKKNWSNLTMPTRKDLPRVALKRCAIVASGPSVLNATAGKDIDAVDGLVMRVNRPKTQGYEAFVGSRTDVLFVNDKIPCQWKAGRFPAEVKMVVVLPRWLPDYTCMKFLMERYPQVPFFVLESRIMTRASLGFSH